MDTNLTKLQQQIMDDFEAVIQKHGIDKLTIVCQDPDSAYMLTKSAGPAPWRYGALLLEAGRVKNQWEEE